MYLVSLLLSSEMYQRVCILSPSFRTTQWNTLRLIAHNTVKNAEARQLEDSSTEWANAKPFSAIPGPSRFQLIRGFYPGGIYYQKPMDVFITMTREMYGDIFLLPGMFGKKSMLFSYNIDDFPTLLHCEGIWPRRSGLETMNYHRKIHRKADFGDVVGLLGSNDEKWGKLRSAVNPILMQPRNARLYINKMLEVNDEFLQRIREIRDPITLEVPETFEDEINRLVFESVAVIALNRQIGLIRKDRDNEEAKRLFKSLKDLFIQLPHLELAPSIWRIVKTKKFNEIMDTYDTMYDILMKYINQSLDQIENNKSPTKDNEEKSVLEKLLKIDKKIAIIMAFDMLFGGVETTSTTLVGILLGIAKNPEKQDKLRQEIREILPKKDSQLTMENMKNMPYLRACIKEGMRMYPIGGGTLRTNSEDVVLSGYQVPKDQNILIGSSVLLMEEKYVSRPKEFIPERWLRSEKNDVLQVNPYLFIPFGHGPRSCVGKRIVEMELEITVARLVRNFNLEFNYSTENAFVNRLVYVPAIPLKFKFSEIDN